MGHLYPIALIGHFSSCGFGFIWFGLWIPANT